MKEATTVDHENRIKRRLAHAGFKVVSVTSEIDDRNDPAVGFQVVVRGKGLRIPDAPQLHRVLRAKRRKIARRLHRLLWDYSYSIEFV